MEEDLISIQEFARKYRVEPETVRSWIKQGLIGYVMVNAHKMIRKTEVVRPLEEEEDPVV